MRAETEAAIAAAEIAQRIADSREGAEIITPKVGIDLVTATDVACEDAIRAELLRRFPGHAVIGEERGGTPANGQPYWLVDPICGTRSFASNLPLYCTNVALVENGIVTVAAVAVGKTGEIVYGEQGHGARIRSSAGENIINANAQSNMVWMEGGSQHAAAAIHTAILRRRWYVCVFPSSVFGAYAAMGRVAAVVRIGLTVPPSGMGSVHWAASCFLAAEAGAIVTDLDTHRNWTFKTRSFVLAASRELHDELCDVVEQARKDLA